MKDQDQQLSFTEIAKTVGERWQILPAEARETYQRQAEAGKEKHHAELAEYMKTLQYDTHQRYLEEFKAKHSASHHRSSSSCLLLVSRRHCKFLTETAASMPTNTHNYCDGQSVRKVSSAVLDHPTAERDRTELGLAANLPRSESSTAAAHSLLALNPTALEDPSLPTFASLGPATLPRWESYGLHPLTVTRSISEQNADLDIPTSSSSYNNLPTSGSTATPSVSVKSPLSLSFHDQPHPSGTHDGSSPAFPGSRGYVDVNCAGQFRAHTDGLDFPPVLLQLVPSLGPTLRPLDPPAQTSSSRQQPQETCLSSSFAALLRAGGLARIADAKTETSRLPSKSDCS